MSTMTVEIDVADDDRLAAEAQAVGCTAVCTGTNRNGYEYRVSGPQEAVSFLLEQWGYEPGEWTVVV